MRAFRVLFLLGLATDLATAEDFGLLSDHPWEDGLYSTITVFSSCDKAELQNVQKVKLLVDGARREIEVKAILQSKPAPLVVILNGTFGNPLENIGKLWAAWLADEGAHVLSFPSTFRADMAAALGLGVSGCLEAEADWAGRIIAAFLMTEQARGKVRGIGVVGMSYGATQALILAGKDRSGPRGYRIEAVTAFSPPIRFAASIGIVDADYRISHWAKACKLTDLYGDFAGLQRDRDLQEPLDTDRMKAAIGRAFRLELEDVVDAADRGFRKTFCALRRSGVEVLLLPDGHEDEDARLAAIEAVTFGQYVEQMVVPFWVAKGRVANLHELLRMGDLALLMDRADRGRVETVLAQNDPLNEPEAWRAFQGAEKVVILPRGGHLGYADSAWTRARIRRHVERLKEACRSQPGVGDTARNDREERVFGSPRR